MVPTSFFQSPPGCKAIGSAAWLTAGAPARVGSRKTTALRLVGLALPALSRGRFGMTLALTTLNPLE
jgi:hypothetical protein